jgi:hypothetical protein
MKTHTRRAAAVAGIALLVGAAGSGTLASQGQTEQQITHDAVILISAVTPDHNHRADGAADHHRTHRADWRTHQTDGRTHKTDASGRKESSRSRTGQGTARAGVGVEAAAALNPPSGVEVVLRHLPGVDSSRKSCS